MNTSPILPYFSNKYSMSSALVRYVRLSTLRDTMFDVSGGGPLVYLDILKIQRVISLWNNANIHLIWWGEVTKSGLKNTYNSYTRSWHSSKLNSSKFLVQVKLVQVITRSWAREGDQHLAFILVHENLSFMKEVWLQCFCVVELFILIKLHSQNIVLSAAFNQIQNFG